MRLFEPTETEYPFSASCRGYCPPLSPRLLSRKHHAVEFFRLRLADICEAFPMARTAPPRGTISRPPMQPGLFMQTEDVLWLPAAGICAELAVVTERDGLPNKCGKSPDTACACRERYGMRQSGLCDGFQEYDRQQPPRGLLPVMIPIRCDFDPFPSRENIFLGDIIRSRDRWFPGRSPDGYFPYAFRTGITESNRPPRRLPNPSPRFHPPRVPPAGR